MTAAVICRRVSIALGALLLLITHEALVAGNASCIAEPEKAPVIERLP
jgi:hypothetical protein